MSVAMLRVSTHTDLPRSSVLFRRSSTMHLDLIPRECSTCNLFLRRTSYSCTSTSGLGISTRSFTWVEGVPLSPLDYLS